MKFRQLKASLEQVDLKIISPSLHDDPAFSADPHSNPYSVTSHGSCLSPPPPGHPILKNNKKRPNFALVSHGTPDYSDSDFQLVQPPNSPDIPSGSNSSQHRPITTNPLTLYNKLPTLSSASSSMNQGLNPSVMSQGGRRPSLLKKRMNFLSRRQSAQVAQPQSVKSLISSMGMRERRRSDLPSFPGDTVLPQPIQQTEGLTTSASAPQILGYRGRVQDLDQIDVLDETNPWGIRIHHDGPYEAVNVQVNKRAGHVPLGLSNGLYNAHGLQVNDQVLHKFSTHGGLFCLHIFLSDLHTSSSSNRRVLESLSGPDSPTSISCSIHPTCRVQYASWPIYTSFPSGTASLASQ
jgi:hypothetical protein